MKTSHQTIPITAAAVAMLLMAGPAWADVTARQVIAGFRNRDQVVAIFWSGLTLGTVAANKASATPIFCPQPAVSMKDRDLIDIMERYLDHLSPDANGLPQDILIASLRDAFPCGPKS